MDVEKMKIEVSIPLSKHLFHLKSIPIETNETKISNILALEKLLSSEPACNYVSNQQDGEVEENKATNIESSSISKHQLAEYRDAFSLFNKNQDGKITKQELRSVMLNLKQNIKFSEIDDVMKENEIQNDDINFEQFVQVLQTIQVDQDLKEVFRVFDKRNMGYICPSDLRAAWQSFGISLSDQEIDEMIAEVDADGDGRISFSEFVNVLNTHTEGESDDDDFPNKPNI